eukprot:2126608-Prymnesium_polylepis.1
MIATAQFAASIAGLSSCDAESGLVLCRAAHILSQPLQQRQSARLVYAARSCTEDCLAECARSWICAQGRSSRTEAGADRPLHNRKMPTSCGGAHSRFLEHEACSGDCPLSHVQMAGCGCHVQDILARQEAAPIRAIRLRHRAAVLV